MEVTARYQGGVRFEIEARGHKIICDQPIENGGSDAGMSQPELLLGSLAACAGHYVAQYLNARGLPGDLEIKVHAEKALQPARLASFRIEINAGELPERHREGVLRAAKACLIHNTLGTNSQIDVELNAPSLMTA